MREDLFSSLSWLEASVLVSRSHGLGYAAIAVLLGVSRKSVSTALERARRKYSKALAVV